MLLTQGSTRSFGVQFLVNFRRNSKLYNVGFTVPKPYSGTKTGPRNSDLSDVLIGSGKVCDSMGFLSVTDLNET